MGTIKTTLTRHLSKYPGKDSAEELALLYRMNSEISKRMVELCVEVNYPQDAKCKYCGQKNLSWMLFPSGHRLVESTGKIHTCGEYKK